MLTIGKTYYYFDDYIDIIKIISHNQGTYSYELLDSDIDKTDNELFDKSSDTAFHHGSLYYLGLKETTCYTIKQLMLDHPEEFL